MRLGRSFGLQALSCAGDTRFRPHHDNVSSYLCDRAIGFSSRQVADGRGRASLYGNPPCLIPWTQSQVRQAARSVAPVVTAAQRHVSPP